ncbi:MAG: FAD-dependent oxidoreductase [Hyphomonadaceae bacterium]|nr:FAD-dependent oxidoreductase [Hyphomonadaceae bacterium]
MSAQNWDETVDVLVVGSGAGAMTAALAAATRHAKTLVIEKGELWGGTSATSGGGIWIPNSHLAKQAGAEDTPEEAFKYVRALAADNVPDSLIQSYIERSPQMLAWLETVSPVRYAAIPYTDYHAELPGGKLGYRAHLPLPLDGRLLGDDVLTIRPVHPSANLFGRMNWSLAETYPLMFRTPGWWKTLLTLFWRYFSDVEQRLRSSTDRYLTSGNALVGGLKIALNQKGVPVRLKTRLLDLVSEDGRVVGAIVDEDGRTKRIRANKGIILGAGGFERNAALRKQHFGSEATNRSGSQVNNTGDALLAAMKLGAATRNLDNAWWAPVFCVPGEDRSRPTFMERAFPGSIIVNQAGKRYMNEAASYHIVGHEMALKNTPEAPTDPSYVIFDAEFRRKYPMGPLMPLIPDWAQSAGVRQILKKADTIEDLARATKLPVAALKETVARFNVGADRGEDPEFQRGAAAYDNFYGDPRQKPNPNLAPIRKAPFYALPIHPGDIGTSGGLVTDEHARVLDQTNRPIGGLYAIGNTAASSMGGSYPGAGVTIGPAMTFGYAAALDATGANA